MSYVPELSPNRTPSRIEQIRELMRDCFQRRSAGQAITDDSVIADHPELMPELAAELAKLRQLEAAWQAAESGVGDQSFAPTDERSKELSVRCPHCHTPTPVVVDSSLAEIVCSSCGTHFSLVGTAEGDDPLDGSSRIGRFELIDQLGVGGFGAVWKAYDPELDRMVALKVPRRGQLTTAEAEQFFREARAVAQLRHPHIVSVYEVGRDADRVYIVSDLVEGPSLAERNTTQRMSVVEAATFCRQVAEALAHAHAAGVIHRDLKPANILIDAAGEPHLADFGLASRKAQETTVTIDGQMLGTPAYMSPEQARGEAHSADHRSDLFSLGVILFEVLTGELPFRGSVRMLLEQILEHEPASPRSLNSLVPRDLETICLKCLEKDPDRRYLSARHLAEDLGRFLRREPILARPVGRFERAWRWCKRKPTQAALVALLVLVGVAAPVAALQQRASRQAAQLQAQAARWQQYLSDMHAAMKSWDDGEIKRVLEILERNRPAPGQPDLRRFEWYYLWRQCQPGLAAVTYHNNDGVWAVAPSADGTKVVAGIRSSDSDIVLNVWDVKSHTQLYSLSGQNAVHSVAISPDDRFFASGGSDRKLCIWDLATGSLLHEITGDYGLVAGVAISPDGGLVAYTCDDQTAKLWNSKTGDLVHVFDAPNMEFCRGSLAFAPDGQTLAAGTRDGSVWMWNVPARSLTQILHGHKGNVRGVAFSPDGQVFATVGEDRMVRLWNTADRSPRNSLYGHTTTIFAVDFSPDGSTLATAGGMDGTVRVWDVDTGNERYCLRGHSGAVIAVRFSGNRIVISGGSDGTVKAWDLTRPADVNVLRGATHQTWSVQISPDGKTVIAGGGDGAVRVWDLQTGKLLATHPVRAAELITDINGLALSPDGRRVAIGGAGHIEIWNPTTDEAVVLREVGRQVNSLAWSHDGRTLVSGDNDDAAILWDPVMAKERTRLPGHKRWICSVAFSPDDRTLVTRCMDDTLRIWDPSTDTLLKTIDGLSGYFFSPLAFSADGTLLACADLNHVIQIRETAGWEVVRTAVGHTDHVKGLAFSPDGRTLASASDDGTVRLWEVTTGEERCMLRGHLGEVDGVKFTPDGQTLVSCGQDGTVRIWRTAPLAAFSGTGPSE